MQTIHRRIAAVGISVRRVSFVCLDTRLRVLVSRTWYLRRLPTIRAKADCACRRLRQSLSEWHPDRLLVEKPAGLPQQGEAMRLADAMVDEARRSGLHVERTSLRAACREISGAESVKRCSEILAAQHEPVARFLAKAKVRWMWSDDFMRDRRSMLAAIAIAHAAVLEELQGR